MFTATGLLFLVDDLVQLFMQEDGNPIFGILGRWNVIRDVRAVDDSALC